MNARKQIIRSIANKLDVEKMLWTFEEVIMARMRDDGSKIEKKKKKLYHADKWYKSQG